MLASVKNDCRARVLPASRGHALSDWSLRESIRREGLLEPVLYHRGRIIDGKRRRYVCQCLRIPLRTVAIDDPELAAKRLWVYHPQRAYRLFAPPGKPSRAKLAALFGCPPSEIPTIDQARDKLHSGQRRLERNRTIARLPAVDVPRVELTRAHAACRERGVTLSAAIRGLVRYLAAESSEPTQE